MLEVSRQRQGGSDEAAADGNSSPVQPHLSAGYTQVLQQVAAAARQCCEGAGEPAVKLQRLTRAMDEAGAAWLVAALQQLPSGTAVCSISRQASDVSGLAEGESDGLLLSRVLLNDEGELSTALLLQLPGRAANATRCADRGV